MARVRGIFCFLPQGIVGDVVLAHCYKCLDARGARIIGWDGRVVKKVCEEVWRGVEREAI
jgi:hypothetical protein